MTNAQIVRYLVPLAVVAIVMALRFRNMGKARPLKLNRLWVVPVLLVGIALFTIAANPPGALGLAICAVALAVGAAIGWRRGKMMRIMRDPETGKLSQVASPAAMLLLLAIIAVRFGVRAYFGGNPTPGNLDKQTLLLTDALLMFAVGLISMTRVEMAIRARRILAEAPGHQ